MRDKRDRDGDHEVAVEPPVAELETRANLIRGILRAHPQQQQSQQQQQQQQQAKRSRSHDERFFLVDFAWWSRFQKGDFSVPNPGPVDNTRLVHPGTSSKLRVNLSQHFDYEVVPEEVWGLLKAWYGFRGPEIVRLLDDNGNLEVYPLVLRVNMISHERADAIQNLDPDFEVEVSVDCTVAALMEMLVQRYFGSNCNNLSVSLKWCQYKDFIPVRTTPGTVKLRELAWNPNDRVLLVVTHNNNNTKPAPPRYDNNDEKETLRGLERLHTSASEPQRASTTRNVGDGKGDLANRHGIVGLSNLGNTCYLNAVLQCLSHTPPLRALFLGNQAQTRVNEASKWGRKGAVVREVDALLREMWSGKHKTIVPSAFKESLDAWTPQFRGRHQQDAHEALAFLLDALHEDTNFGFGAAATTSATDPSRAPSNNKSITEQLMTGRLASKVTCPHCGFHSTSEEAFQMLSLELGGGQPMESFTFVGVDNAQRSVTLSRAGDGTVRDLLARVREVVATPKHVCVARVRRSVVPGTKNDLRNVEVLFPDARYNNVPAPWEIVVFELEHPFEGPSPPQLVNVSVRHGTPRALRGMPFVVACAPSATKRDLFDQLVRRFSTSSADAARIRVKLSTKSRLVSDEVNEFDVSDAPLKDMPAQMVVVVDVLDDANTVVGADAAAAATSQKQQQRSGASPNGDANNNKSKNDDNNDTLEQRLSAFCAEEVLGEDNLWFCERCQAKRPATKQISFRELPEILILQLKRFTAQGSKLSSPVKFPLVLRVDADNQFDLYAIVRHHGKHVSGGHYDAIIRNSMDNRWYQMNDSSASPLPGSVVLGPASKFRGAIFPALPDLNDPSAYMFFYRKLLPVGRL